MKKRNLVIFGAAMAVSVLGLGAFLMFGSPEGKIVNLPIKAEELPGYNVSGPELAIYGGKVTDSPATVKAALEKKGYYVKLYEKTYTQVAGVHGDTVNLAYSNEATVPAITAEKKPIELKYWRYLSNGQREGIEDPSDYSYRVTFFGNRVTNTHVRVRWSYKLDEGPKWVDLSSDLINNMQAKNGFLLRPFLTVGKSGQQKIFFDELGKTTTEGDAPFVYSLETWSCNEKPDRVCQMWLVFWDGRTSPEESSIELLKQKYVSHFGQPDCWLDDDACSSRQLGDTDANAVVRAMEKKARQL